MRKGIFFFLKKAFVSFLSQGKHLRSLPRFVCVIIIVPVVIAIIILAITLVIRVLVLCRELC